MVKARTEVSSDGLVPPPPLVSEPISDRKREILDGLEAIVLDEGFRTLRLTEVAQRLSASNTTLYQIAATKDELLMLVIDRWFQANGRRTWHQVAQAAGPAQRLEMWLLGGVSGGARGSRRFWEDVSTHAGLSRMSEAYRRYYVATIERLIEVGVAAGVFRAVSPHVAALVFDAAAVRLHDPRESAAVDADVVEQRGRELIDLLFHGILEDA